MAAVGKGLELPPLVALGVWVVSKNVRTVEIRTGENSLMWSETRPQCERIVLKGPSVDAHEIPRASEKPQNST
jgi:hypothetical protein